jgi:hypothetical protein
MHECARRRVVRGGPLPCVVSVPGPVEVERAPLLVFLHGYGEGAPLPIEEAVARHGPLSATAPRLVRESFVILAPQLPRRGDLWLRFGDAVATTVDHVTATLKIDGDRRFLSGFSFGGNGVLDLGLAQRGLWTALWAVDPTRVPEADPGLPVWLSAGALSRHEISSYTERLGLQPVDPDPGTQSRIMTDAGHDHVGTATAAFSDERVYRWLLSRAPAAPGTPRALERTR